MVVLDKSTFNECLEKGVDVMLDNFAHIIEATSFEQLAANSDVMVFKDKYKAFQEQRLLSGAAANIFDSASLILGLCSEIKRELLINGLSHENFSTKARYFTLMDHQENAKSNIKAFSNDLDEIVKVLEVALYNRAPYSCDKAIPPEYMEDNTDSDTSIHLDFFHS